MTVMLSFTVHCITDVPLIAIVAAVRVAGSVNRSVHAFAATVGRVIGVILLLAVAAGDATTQAWHQALAARPAECASRRRVWSQSHQLAYRMLA